MKNKFRNGLGDEVEHGSGQARVHANPEDVVHDIVRVDQTAHATSFATFVGGLPEKIASEQQACSNFSALKSAQSIPRA